MNVMIKDENPLIAIRGDIDLSEVEYPAITICSEQTTKYAFAERLGNYLDPDESLPDLLAKLQSKFLENALERYTGYTYTYERQCKTTNDRIDKTGEVSVVHCVLFITWKCSLKYSTIFSFCILKLSDHLIKTATF